MTTYWLESLDNFSDNNKSNFNEPVGRIKKNIKKNFKVFDALLKHYYTTGDFPETMASYSYNGIHPMIPASYYDKLVDGVPHVIDEPTGALIKRKDAIPVSKGYFVSLADPRIVDLSSLRREVVKRHFKKQPITGEHIFKKSEYYIVASFEEVKPVVSINTANLTGFLYDSLMCFLSKTKIQMTFDDFESTVDQKLFMDFVKYTNTKHMFVSGNSDWFDVELLNVHSPHTSGNYSLELTGDILPGVTVTGLSTRVLDAIQAGWSKDEERFLNTPVACMFINRARTNPTVVDNSGSSRQHLERTLFLRDLGIEVDCPFELALLSERFHQTKRNLNTENSSGLLLNYSAKAPRIKKSFLKEPYEKEPCWLGLEWEIESRVGRTSERSMLIRDIEGSLAGDYLIMKSDSSIDPFRGLEIVTVPATLAYHKKKLQAFFEGDRPINRRFQSSTRTGIHVHIDKKMFSPLSLGKFVAFINKEENLSFVELMAGRSIRHSRYSPKIDVDGSPNYKRHKEIGVDVASRIGSYGDYIAGHASSVNTSLRSTIELRIFKSTNSKGNLFRKLEFVDCLVKFVSSSRFSIQQMTVYDFVSFCLQKEVRKEYPFLLNWLSEKGLVERQRVKIKGKHKFTYVYGKHVLTPPVNSVYHNKRIYGNAAIKERKSELRQKKIKEPQKVREIIDPAPLGFLEIPTHSNPPQARRGQVNVNNWLDNVQIQYFNDTDNSF